MAVKIVETILKVNTEISEPAQVETLLDFVKPLIADIPGVEVDEEVCLHLIMHNFLCATNIVCRVGSGGIISLFRAFFDHGVRMVASTSQHAGFHRREGSSTRVIFVSIPALSWWSAG